MFRHRIEALREHLYYHYYDSWHGLVEDPDALARRALAIPGDLRLSYPLAVRIFHAVLGIFTPARVALWIAKHQLRGVRSYRGRQLVFAALVRRWFTSGRQLEYTPALDFIFRHAQGPASHELLQSLEHKDLCWLRACYKVGERSMAQLASRLKGPLEGNDGPLVELLVDEGVICSAEELTAWPCRCRPAYLRVIDRHSQQDFASARTIVRRLVQLGVAPGAIVNACQGGTPDFQPRQFEENLALLEAHRIEVRPLAEAVGKLLWTAPAARWRFLLDILKLNDAAELARFTDFLAAHAEPNARLANALIERGTSPQGLAACQSVLMLDTRDSEAPVHALQRIAGPPFSFGAEDFGHVRGYARDSSSLDTFLDALARHSLTAPAEVLAFERCYQAFQSEWLSPLLDVAVPRRGQATAAELADWVYRAGRIGHVEACAIGAHLLGLRSLPDLERLLAVAPLGASVLRYLIVDKRLATLKSLLDWFYDRAAGVLEMKLWRPLGDFERFSLDDAFDRCCYTRVSHNISCLHEAAHSRVQALLGPRPLGLDATALAAYDEARQQVIETQRRAVLEDAGRIMPMTGGVLFTSLLEVASPEQAEARLAVVAPLLDELLAGRGPTDPTLADIEAEAVALVYETTPGNVEQLWSSVTGRQSDLASLVLADHYPMRWRKVHRRLRDGAQLNIKNLSAIARLPALVSNIRAHWSSSMFDACKGLRPSQFRAAADVDGLAHHLAVLCSLAYGDEQVDGNLRRWEQIRESLLAGSVPYEELEQLQTFIDTTLPDALAVLASSRLGRLSDNDARLLERQLGAPVPDDVAGMAARLQSAIAATLHKVQTTSRRWLARERGKFPKVRDGQAETVLRAIASKAPATFFARQAVALCTRYNVDMWKEPRHSHLVVFDPAQRCMAGMAMLFLEVVPAIDPERPALIIRALNPVARYASQHDVATIVDAFFDTALSIAADNALAAVAFPGDGGMDLLSNVPAVQRDIQKRYVGRAGRYLSHKAMPSAHGRRLDRPARVDAPFDGYARGGGGNVSSLYVIWRGGEQALPASSADPSQRQEAAWTTTA
ncbi:hypothetical protein [Azohydromonas caseinilytica]|uniref:hypothetical protein n=1 Tax=Azohydromonas caseinilytica TaxID=2728836 RepID=UPI00197BDCA1|nr:hypothetical protein [Azohydromonas caseinilytica]